MKHCVPFFAACLIAALTLSGCKEKIELNDLNTRVSVDLGLAMPVGTTYATLGDFLGGKAQDKIEIDKDGIIHLIHDTIMERNFRSMDITHYPASALKEFNVGEKISTILPGQSYEIEYPTEVEFDNINKTPTDQRMDSISVLTANYKSVINLSNDLIAQGFKWDWITKVEVVLKDQFFRKEGNIVPVYKKGEQTDITDFGQDINISIDNFKLYLMKDMHKPAGNDNVLKTATMSIKYYISVPATASTITVTPTSTIYYNLNLQMLTFDAVWGYAKPSGEMRDVQKFEVSSIWDMWKKLKKATLPLVEPSIEFDIRSKVAGKLQMNAHYFYAVADANLTDTIWASFNGSKSRVYEWNDNTKEDKHFIELDERTIGDSISHIVVLNEEAENGAIDRLFRARPDRVGYQFDVEVYDPEKTYPQVRLSPDNRFDVDAHIDLPMVFDKGLAVQLDDTLKDVKLSQLSLDSILNGALGRENVQNANVVLYVGFTNHIPMGVSAKVKFTDENDNEILLNGKPIRLIKYGENTATAPSDTINLKMPDVEAMSRTDRGDVYVAKSEQTPEQYIIDIDRDNFEAFSKTKNIIFSFSLHNNGEKVIYPVAVQNTASLSAKVGVTARINGKIDLNKLLSNK